ncbi:MAG: hypothetical protein POELPBGB_03595 [Bacteroidia bacterium]|nr:hypothetical protein [Bacteroidia bacterium]
MTSGELQSLIDRCESIGRLFEELALGEQILPFNSYELCLIKLKELIKTKNTASYLEEQKNKLVRAKVRYSRSSFYNFSGEMIIIDGIIKYIDQKLNADELSEANEVIKKLNEIIAKKNNKVNRDKSQKITRFEDILTDIGKELLPKLINAYKEAGKQEFAIMLFALYKSGVTNIDPYKFQNASQLHLITTNAFGDIGSRYNLSKNLAMLNTPSKRLQNKIDVHINKILELIKNK